MYRAYEKIVTPDEKGLFDFIGDYLLSGKDLLGHSAPLDGLVINAGIKLKIF